MMIIPTALLLLSEAISAGPPGASPEPQPVFDTTVGEGFRKHAHSIEVKVTRAFGTTQTGSVQAHHLWLTQIQGGWMLTDVLARDHWWGGNLEAVGQLIIGGQDRPDDAYFLGLNGGLRYHFRTGTAVDPFIAGSIGIAGTDIGEPDLGGKFQFDQQIGVGLRYLFSAHHAITLEYDYWHVSNGGIREPNDGVNAHLVSIGFAWLF
jgi:hypothetical protein